MMVEIVQLLQQQLLKQQLRVAIDELLCLKNVFHLKRIMGTHCNRKNPNPGGRFGATS